MLIFLHFRFVDTKCGYTGRIVLKMKVLYLTITNMANLDSQGIYQDLVKEFVANGHDVYVVSPRQKRLGKQTEFIENGHFHALLVRIGNITKCGLLEKGISMLLLERQYMAAIDRYLKDIRFDLVLYSTPPITFSGIVKKIKKRDGAKSYLMLKDIFPQNAVDLGIMSKTGIKGLAYRYFRRQEQELYNISDYIGCMSPANVEYLLANNPGIDKSRVGLCPNSLEIADYRISPAEKTAMRTKYNLPLDKKIFIYGGNLGLPQGIPFLMECLKSQKDRKDVFFFISGSGTEYGRLKDFVDSLGANNIRLSSWIPREDYSRLTAACDVGLIFLDYRFTIPNFPNRLLAYMQAGLPVISCTDPNTDVGKICQQGGFGWSCPSNSVKDFSECVSKACSADLLSMGQKSWECLNANYDVRLAYKGIMEAVNL